MHETWGFHFSYSDIKHMKFKGSDWIRGIKIVRQAFNYEMYSKDSNQDPTKQLI